MALITLDIGNSATRINDAYAATYNYSAMLGDGSPNPQTKSQFTKAKIAELIKNFVRDYEARLAMEAAKAQAVANVESQVVIV